MLVIVSQGLASWRDSKADPLQGGYILYGGDLGDWYAPKPGDAKVNVEMQGALAKQMFDLMGARAEKKDTCNENATRTRVAGDIVCIRVRSGATHCHFGLDLTKGRTVAGLIC
jgi:hypothetical protein